MRLLRKLGCDARGATAIEYGLILALVFLAMVGAVQLLARSVIGTWNVVSTNVANAVGN